MRQVFAAVLLFVSIGARAQFGSQVDLFSYTDADGVSEKFVITPGRAEKIPKWEPARTPPPLSLEQAVAVADTWLKKKYPDVKAFSISRITIAELSPRPTYANRWYYELDFDAIVGGKRGGGSRFMAVVLFDGSVVEPKPNTPRKPASR